MAFAAECLQVVEVVGAPRGDADNVVYFKVRRNKSVADITLPSLPGGDGPALQFGPPSSGVGHSLALQ